MIEETKKKKLLAKKRIKKFKEYQSVKSPLANLTIRQLYLLNKELNLNLKID
jgi:hypothetical protein